MAINKEFFRNTRQQDAFKKVFLKSLCVIVIFFVVPFFLVTWFEPSRSVKVIYEKLKLDYIFHYGNEWDDSARVMCSFIREFLTKCVQAIGDISIKAETFTATATLINTLLATGSKNVIEQRGIRRYGINTEGYREFTQMLTFSQHVYKGSIILIVLSLYLLVIDQMILSICVCICNFGVSLVMMDIGYVVQNEKFWMKVSKETYRRALSNADEWERYLSELCKEDAVYKDSHQFTFLLDVLREANELFEAKWMEGSIQGKDRVLLKLYVKNIYTILRQANSRNVLESHYLAYRNYIKKDPSEGKTKLQATIDIIAYHCLSKLAADEGRHSVFMDYLYMDSDSSPELYACCKTILLNDCLPSSAEGVFSIEPDLNRLSEEERRKYLDLRSIFLEIKVGE